MSALPADPVSLDVRPLPRPQRHVLILRQFDALGPGEAFELVNDHDPLGLLHQFHQLLPGLFTWDYLETGPEAWRVLIGRVGAYEPAAAHSAQGGCTCGSTSGGCG